MPTTTAQAVKVTIGEGFGGTEPTALRDAIEEIASQGNTINRRILGRYVERQWRRLAGRWFETWHAAPWLANMGAQGRRSVTWPRWVWWVRWVWGVCSER